MQLPSIHDFIDIHVHEVSTSCFSLQNIFAQEIGDPFDPQHYCSIGLHPWHITDEAPVLIGRIQKVLDHDAVLAVGETGLDKTISTPIGLQEELFIKQWMLAEAVSKPVIIHCVKAYSELLHIRKHHALKMPWIMHWFNENIQIANQLIDSDCYLSFGRSLLHPNGRNAAVFSQVPLDRVFFETDDAGISIESVYSKAAGIRNMDLVHLKSCIAGNFNTIFSKVK